MNDGISTELSSLSYTSVDEVMRRVLELGKGAQMAKADIRQAYRNIPGTSGRQRAIGHAVARAAAGGWLPAIRHAVGPPAVHGSSRFIAVGDV